jgi:hypothetical protein
MGRIVLFIVIGAVLAGLWARSALVEKKKAEKKKAQDQEKMDREKNAPTELNKHPERLEQNLDPTDDA